MPGAAHDGFATPIAGSGPPVVMPALERELARIEAHLRTVEARLAPVLGAVHPDWAESARNLVHYAALRQLDLRELQLLLQQHGLSSLGRSESFVMASLLAVRARVHDALAAHGVTSGVDRIDVAARRGDAVSWQMAEFLLHAHTHAALGSKPEDRHVYVMVTAPDAAEVDRAWLARLLRAGMNVLRINCAHEGPAEWQRILTALAAARHDTGVECRVLMDLGGPKIRTGRIAESTRVATWKLHRDELGRVVEPSRVVVRPVSRAGVAADGAVLLLAEDRKSVV